MARTPFVLYHYDPSIAAAITFTIVFALLACAHLWGMIRLRAYFYLPVVIGCCFEIAAYASRIASHFNTLSLGPYIIQSLLILVAPPLFASTIYMTLGRLIRSLNASHLSLIPLSWLTKIFVIGDVLCFLIQAGGGGIQATSARNPNNMTLGRNIVLGGLCLQVLIFLVFVAAAWNFHLRYSNSVLGSGLPWKKYMRGIYFASLFILVRNIVRIVEYEEGNDGFVVSHEVFVYVFDALPMAATASLLYVVHGGRSVHEIQSNQIQQTMPAMASRQSSSRFSGGSDVEMQAAEVVGKSRVERSQNGSK